MDNTVAHLPAFTIAPPLRCYAQVGELKTSLCGELARWKRPGSNWFADAFFCNDHALPSDVAIVGEQVVRRVHLTVDVYMAGVSPSAPHAQAEALARLGAAVAAAGGLLDTERVLSGFGRWPAQADAGAQNAGKGSRG